MQPQEVGHWQDKMKKYAQEEWADKPSLFAEFAASYMPSEGSLLELGSGLGQDSIYFALKGLKVTQTDAVDDCFVIAKEKAVGAGAELTQKTLDLWQSVPFSDETFDVVYAHLALHYFDAKQTQAIFKEIYRILKPGGMLAAMFNSTDDPEYGDGQEIEPDYFQVGDLRKRYFSVESLRPYLENFEIEVLDNDGETYKDLQKGTFHQIRLIAKKI